MADSKIILLKDLMDKVIEELTEYRAIGTVEGYERAIQSSIGNYNLYREYKAKVRQFEAIGTIEEFKALKEKSEPKKPIYSDFEDNGNDESIPYKAICPVCGYEFNFGSWNEEENHHCRCGQAIDWR